MTIWQKNKWIEILEEVLEMEISDFYPVYFESKKNQVTLFDLKTSKGSRKVVGKYFVWGELERELELLHKGNVLGINLPGVYGSFEKILFIEYIEGKTLKFVLENEPQNYKPELLGNWIADFHWKFADSCGKTCLKGDSMLPNFIFSQDKETLAGVDFEEWKWGEPLEEFADIFTTHLILEEESIDLLGISYKFYNSYIDINPLKIDIPVFKTMVREQLEKRMKFWPKRKKELRKLLTRLEQSNHIENILTENNQLY
ncbi:MAG: hypothetical protein ACLFQV_06770 [Vulcanimicrobiota bacterium]